jgi:hypothetical protein
VALRVRGSTRSRAEKDDIAAHSSAVQVLVGGAPIYSEPEAAAVLAQIEGSLRYVEVLAPRPDEPRFMAMKATLQAAHRQMHALMGEHHHS